MALLKHAFHQLPVFLLLASQTVLLWILLLPQFESPFAIQLDVRPAKSIFMLSVFCGVILFTINYVLPPRRRGKVKAVYFLAVPAVANILTALTYFVCILWILDVRDSRITHRFGIVAQPLWSLFFCSYCAALGWAFRLYNRSVRRREQDEKREKEMFEIGLLALKNQLSPHFLFNVLNTIDSQIQNNPQSASSTLIRLSKLLRHIIYEDSPLALEKEVSFLRDYVALQSARISGIPEVLFQVDIADGKQSIAPAIFLPYIENAFKHGRTGKAGSPISFSITQRQEAITFVSANAVDDPYPANGNRPKGKGMDIAQRRLLLLYPEAHSIRISQTSGVFRVQIKLWKNLPA